MSAAKYACLNRIINRNLIGRVIFGIDDELTSFIEKPVAIFG